MINIKVALPLFLQEKHTNSEKVESRNTSTLHDCLSTEAKHRKRLNSILFHLIK